MKQNCGSYHERQYEELKRKYKSTNITNIFHNFDCLCKHEINLNDEYDYSNWKDQEAAVYVDFIYDFLNSYKKKSKNYLAILFLIRVGNPSELHSYISLDNRFDKF